MDFKEPGNLIILLGMTREELGGSLWAEILGQDGGSVPGVVPDLGQAAFQVVYRAVSHGLVRSCHDLSEGGLAVALAEMALAGGLGAEVSLRDVPCEDGAASDPVLLFSESPSRFLLEVPPEHYAALAALAGGLPLGRLGAVTPAPGPAAAGSTRLAVTGLDGSLVIDAPVPELKERWQRTLRW
jgi:phosphoribosylformylglycinamidine synthase